MKTLLPILLFLVGTTSTHAQWRPLDLHTQTRERCVQLHFPTAKVGFAVTPQAVWKTEDGGDSWSRVYTAERWVLTSFFLSDSVGWVAGGFAPRCLVVRTVDGGKTWQTVNSKLYQVYALHFFNKKVGWAIANGETKGMHFIYKTTNGGTRWVQTRSARDYVRHIAFAGRSVGWIFGDNWHIYNTINRGKSWKRQPVEGPVHFVHAAALSRRVVWAVGHYGEGHCYYTQDGGKHWQPRRLPTTHKLHAVAFASAKVGYIVGDNGTILRTTDSGVHWVTEQSGTTENLRAIAAVNDTLVYVGGDAGTVLKRF